MSEAMSEATMSEALERKGVSVTDYADPAHWLSLPGGVDHEVDVFYLYPTTYMKESPDEPDICRVDDPGMTQGARSAFTRQAATFSTLGDIYAPFYRQADAAYCLSLPPAQHEEVVGGIPTQDALAAFDYYVERHNHGRPFILAGHSQGSNVLLYVLSGYMREHPDVYRRMVAAYVIGYSVTPDYLARNPHLDFAEGPDDTGVIVSWNTQAPTFVGENPVVLPGALAINPISWTRDETEAPAAQSLGAISLDPRDGSAMRDEHGDIACVLGLADARVDKARGVVLCGSVSPDRFVVPSGVFPKGLYHSFDYPFYFFDIRANAAERVERFLSAH